MEYDSEPVWFIIISYILAITVLPLVLGLGFGQIWLTHYISPKGTNTNHQKLVTCEHYLFISPRHVCLSERQMSWLAVELTDCSWGKVVISLSYCDWLYSSFEICHCSNSIRSFLTARLWCAFTRASRQTAISLPLLGTQQLPLTRLPVVNCHENTELLPMHTEIEKWQYFYSFASLQEGFLYGLKAGHTINQKNEYSNMKKVLSRTKGFDYLLSYFVILQVWRREFPVQCLPLGCQNKPVRL